jgi:hypothetical protein
VTSLAYGGVSASSKLIDNEFSFASRWQRRCGLTNGSGDELLNLGKGCRSNTDETSLITRAEQYLVGIGKTSAADEAQPDSVRACSDRDDGIGGAFGRTVAQNEEAVVVLPQFVRGRQPLP